MPARDPQRRQDVARIAAARRHGSDSPAVAALHQSIKAEALERHIREVVDAAPPLTDEQRARLAALLTPDAGTAA